MKKYLRFDLFLISFLAIVCAVGLQMGFAASLLRVILAFLLLFILPGYAFYSALFVKDSFGAIEGILSIVGLSILIAILTGATLNLTKWGLQSSSWTAVLSGITLIACLIAGIRRNKADNNSFLFLKLNLGWSQGLMLFLAFLIITGAVGLSRVPITNSANLQGYAILWILPVGDIAPDRVYLGVINDQFTTTDYALRIVVDNKVVYQWHKIELTPGEKWEVSYQIPGILSSVPVEAFLYKLDNPDSVYRQVKLSLGP